MGRDVLADYGQEGGQRVSYQLWTEFMDRGRGAEGKILVMDRIYQWIWIQWI
jgi:hypothetical protein